MYRSRALRFLNAPDPTSKMWSSLPCLEALRLQTIGLSGNTCGPLVPLSCCYSAMHAIGAMAPSQPTLLHGMQACYCGLTLQAIVASPLL